MTTQNEPALSRQLPRREARELLESFASFAPAVGFALVCQGEVLASAGNWPPDALDAVLAPDDDLPRAGSPSFTGQTDGFRAYAVMRGEHRLGTLVARGTPPDGSSALERTLQSSLALLLSVGVDKHEITNEALACYREINLLYRIGETISRSLDTIAIPHLALQQSRLVKADVGLMLLGADGKGTEVKASFGAARDVAALHEVLRGVLALVWEKGRPAILTDLPGKGPSFGALLWAPLRSNERMLGGVALARAAGQPVFTAKDEKLLLALADFSASALENAFLFELVQRQRREEERLLDLTSDVASELLLDALLVKIIAVSTELLEADRGTLFLYDPKTDELWSRVAEGLEIQEIRFPISAGLTGSCFTSGETINIREAYDDPRFNQDVDRQTGYRTHSILCMLIANKQGRKLGVIQVLNKRGGPFTSTDESRLRAFTAQAAIALENAQLFEDVLNERNYNESILRSLSNGVMTLDVNGTVAKVNEAVLRILKRRQDDVLGRPVAALFAHESNAWVLESLDKVGQTGDVDVSIDADITLDGGDVVSTNATVVPLVDVKNEAIGSMIVLEDISREKRVKSAMARYMTKEVADRLLEAGEERLGGSSQVASVLFSDIRSFTTISEELGARDTVSMLNEYFGEMVDVVFSHGGILDKYIGDAIMAVFGVPFVALHDADNAVLVANEMIRVLGELNRQRLQQGKVEIRIGVGISTGELIAGNIGSLKRMDYTVIGDTVNLASRLEGATKYYGVEVLFSEFTAAELRRDARCREIDLIRVKGKKKPVAIFEALDHHSGETFPNMNETVAMFEKGLGHYRRREWNKSLRAFLEALDHNPNDGPSKLYLGRSQYYLEHPPPDDWSGVWTMESK